MTTADMLIELNCPTMQKVTTPGKKKVYRIINTKTGKAEGDYITLEHENPNNEKPLKCSIQFTRIK